MKYDKIETGVNLRQLRIENKLVGRRNDGARCAYFNFFCT